MIQAEHLSMWYGNTKALDDATFEVRRGEVLGLLGPNGAGKTTTLKILTTFMHPFSGRVVVDGIDAAEDPIAVRRKIGYLPETAPLYPDMTVGEYLDFVGRARGLSGDRLAARKAEVCRDCGLEAVLLKPIGHLSKGFRQRTGLAGALIHDPEILILDEPTSGLDPVQIVGIRELVKRLARTKTVLFSTHILQEIQAVSDRVMIMNEGRIVAEGTPEALQRRAMETDCLAVEIGGVTSPVEADDVGRAISALHGVVRVDRREPVRPDGAAYSVRHAFGEDQVGARVEELMRRSNRPIRHFAPDRLSLEQVFMALTRAGSREYGALGGAA